MEILFLNPPSLLHDSHDLAPPLWSLLLGATAERAGLAPRILDLNLEVLDRKAPQDVSNFYTWAVNRIVQSGPDIVCYSSMGLNGHVSLKLAELVKRMRPDVVQFFGGPHFSSIAEEVLQYYPWIDAVFLGEAERSLLDCLTEIKKGRLLSSLSISGMLTRATKSGRSEKVFPSSVDIPKPSYSLVDIGRYFDINPRKTLDFEAGRRGCIYACTYCYAPQHFGQGERSTAPERFIEEMADVARLGAKHLFVVTDNFINYPRRTATLCNEIASAKLGLTFNCYATLAQLNEEVVPSLARAGCTSVYVGVDAVHADARREFAKGLFRSRDDLFSRIDLCLSCGIIPNLAFLLEEPDKGVRRFEDTVATAFAAARRGCPITLNTLTVYPRTRLSREGCWTFIPSDLKARICFDAPDVVHFNPYSIDHPELFPFHSSHRPVNRQGKVLLLAYALKTLSGCAADVVYDICENGVLTEFLELLVGDVCSSAFAALSPLVRRQLIIDRFQSLWNKCAVAV